MRGEDFGERPFERDQALGERLLRVGPDLAVGDVAQPVTLGADHAPAGAAQARVEANQDQPSFSITSSGTS